MEVTVKTQQQLRDYEKNKEVMKVKKNVG